MGSHRQRGFTMVELLVGMTIGLVVIAAALALLVNRIQVHRAALLQSRLMQDLRVAANVVSRDLRRAGYWHDAAAGVAALGAAGTALANPYAAVTLESAPSDAVTFRYSRDAIEDHGIDANEQFGFRLRRGTLEMLLGTGNWQSLTDSTTLVITAFSITPALQEIELEGFCAKECPPDETSCRPRQVVRSLAVSISGHASTDARVVRSLQTVVRLRNDAIVGACPT